MSQLNPLQKRCNLSASRDILRRMDEMAGFLLSADERTSFSQYVADLSPVERRVLRDHFDRIREAMLDLLQTNDIPIEADPISLR